MFGDKSEVRGVWPGRGGSWDLEPGLLGICISARGFPALYCRFLDVLLKHHRNLGLYICRLEAADCLVPRQQT